MEQTNRTALAVSIITLVILIVFVLFSAVFASRMTEFISEINTLNLTETASNVSDMHAKVDELYQVAKQFLNL